MSWFKKLRPSKIRTEGGNKRNVPEGLWTKCTVCTAVLYRPELERNLQVCPKCSHHMRIPARTRLEQFLDPGKQREIAANLESVDALRFKDSKKYKDRISAAERAAGVFFSFRWGPHARGGSIPDADGQDVRRAGANE